jgi:hypothetical protein
MAAVIRHRHPIIAELNELAVKGAHRAKVKTLNRGTAGDPNDRRAYEAVCEACGWTTPGDAKMYRAMLEHAKDTYAATQAAREASASQMRPSPFERVRAEHPNGQPLGHAATGDRAADGQMAKTYAREQVRSTPPDNVRINTDFRDAYQGLEARMKVLAEADGDVFLPNLEPAGPVDYVFICMEPSLNWARSAQEAGARVEAGFRDIHPLILHFCIRQYLCGPTQRYDITDLSKGAMLVEHANVDRTRRYDRWYPLLMAELDLVARPGAHIFAVGKEVENYLRARLFLRRPFSGALHYSDRAVAHRAAAIVGHEKEFEQFKGSLSLENVLPIAQAVLDESVPTTFHALALSQLVRGRQLSESQLQLIFVYKRAFEAARQKSAQAAVLATAR